MLNEELHFAMDSDLLVRLVEAGQDSLSYGLAWAPTVATMVARPLVAAANQLQNRSPSSRLQG